MMLSEHAKEEMFIDDISEEEVRQCLDFGKLELTNNIKGEIRHAKKLDFKDKSVVVVFTFKDDETRVITVYAVRNKWQE